MQLAQRIRLARRKAKLSQEALAKLLGLQRSAVSNWESANPAQPAIANLIAVAKAANVSLDWLATGKGSMHTGHDPYQDVLAIDVEFTDTPHERDLLRAFRAMSHRSQIVFMELAEELVSTRGARRARTKAQ